MRGELYIARNNEIREWIIEAIKAYRLPFKIWIQPIYPSKSPDQLAYLFGVVCKRISEHSGHSPDEVYQGYKKLFNIEYAPDKEGIWRLQYFGASGHTTVDLNEFALKIRADAVLDMGINIELPNECFVSELDFSDSDKIELVDSYDVFKSDIPRVHFKVRNYRRRQA